MFYFIKSEYGFENFEVYYNRKRKHSTLGYRTPAQVDQTIKSAVCF
jgi:putative transposase